MVIITATTSNSNINSNNSTISTDTTISVINQHNVQSVAIMGRAEFIDKEDSRIEVKTINPIINYEYIEKAIPTSNSIIAVNKPKDVISIMNSSISAIPAPSDINNPIPYVGVIMDISATASNSNIDTILPQINYGISLNSNKSNYNVKTYEPSVSTNTEIHMTNVGGANFNSEVVSDDLNINYDYVINSNKSNKNINTITPNIETESIIDSQTSSLNINSISSEVKIDKTIKVYDKVQSASIIGRTTYTQEFDYKNYKISVNEPNISTNTEIHMTKVANANSDSTVVSDGLEIHYDYLFGVPKSNSNINNTADIRTDYVFDVNKSNSNIEAINPDQIFTFGNLIYRGDNYSEQDNSCYVYKPEGDNVKTEYTFYVAGLDENGQYSEPQSITIQHPDIQKPQLTSNHIQSYFAKIKIIMPDIYDGIGNEKDILGYRLYITQVDDTNTVIDSTEVIEFPAKDAKEQTITYDANSGERYAIQLTAYDLFMESPKSDVLYSETFKLREPDIPEDLIDSSKLTNAINTDINDAYDYATTINPNRMDTIEGDVDSNYTGIVQNENEITSVAVALDDPTDPSYGSFSWQTQTSDKISSNVTDINTVEGDVNTVSTQVDQLADRWSVRVQKDVNGNPVAAGGFGIGLDGQTNKVNFNIIADEFALYPTTDSSGNVLGSPTSLFAIDTTDNSIIYMNASEVQIRGGSESSTWVQIDDHINMHSSDGNLDIDTKQGVYKFGGELMAVTGTFKGSLSAASGKLGDSTNYVEFDGTDLNVNTPDLTISNGSAEFSGSLSAASGDFEFLESADGKILIEPSPWTTAEYPRIVLKDADTSNNIANLSGSSLGGELTLTNSSSIRKVFLDITSNSEGQLRLFDDNGVNKIQINASGKVVFGNLPTSDPANFSQLWNDGGTLKISSG